MPVSAGGGGLVKIASGSLAGITSATPQQIDFRTWPALANFQDILVRIRNMKRTAGTFQRDLQMRFLVNGTAGVTGYNDTIGNNQAQIQVALGVASFVNGFADIMVSDFFKNDYPSYAVYGCKTGAAATNAPSNIVGMRGVQAIHNGVDFLLSTTTLTIGFDYTIFGVQK